MKNQNAVRTLFPSQVAVLLLASAMAVPAMAQQSQPTDQPPSAPAATTAPATPAKASSTDLDKEGFWGHVNPFARKKWVKKRPDPINDRLTELDQVNAKNATDIKDVDARAQAGIQQGAVHRRCRQSGCDRSQHPGAETPTPSRRVPPATSTRSTPPSMVLTSTSRSAISTFRSTAACHAVQGREGQLDTWQQASPATRATSSRWKHTLRAPERWYPELAEAG